jgi:hypothetical protein
MFDWLASGVFFQPGGKLEKRNPEAIGGVGQRNESGKEPQIGGQMFSLRKGSEYGHTGRNG